MSDPETTPFPNPISGPSDKQSFITAATQAEPGHLYIVATPIGNLRDITLRAIDILSTVDDILAEDTRQSQKLLNAYNIQTPLSAYHDHNVAKRLPAILAALDAGRSMALISDAGTPLVSDPGFKLVRAAIAAGHVVIPLPGASAILAALVTAGLPSDSFAFHGFLPARSAARKRQLESLNAVPGTLIFFETAPRIHKSLVDMRDILGDRPAALARELTKRYEDIRRGTVSDIIESVITTPPRGEIVVCLGPRLRTEKWEVSDIDKALKPAIEDMGLKRASTHVADLSGWTKRDVYQRALSYK